MSVIDQPTTVKPSLPSEGRQMLLDAIAFLEERGWSSIGPRGPNGEVCIAMALIETAGKDEIYEEQAVHRLMNEMGTLISYWNDYICQSQEEAIAMLRKVANS